MLSMLLDVVVIICVIQMVRHIHYLWEELDLADEAIANLHEHNAELLEELADLKAATPPDHDWPAPHFYFGAN